VRDAISVAQAGKPVVLFVHAPFERAARTQARGQGAPDLRIYVFPQFRTGGMSEQEEREKAAKAALEFPALLGCGE
jgi:hypothetical protein